MGTMAVGPSIAVTGACGNIGRGLAAQLAEKGYRLRLIDRPGEGLKTIADLGDIFEVDLSREAPDELFAGTEVVVHLAGEARNDAPWKSLLRNNIEASYKVASAAMRARCRRLIVASSVHAVWGSARRPVRPDDPVAPADLYGVTKCFVEALAFWCAHSGSMSAAAVRIGAFMPLDATLSSDAKQIADVFIAAPDLLCLLERAIVADYRFAVLHAAAPGRDVLLDTRATEEMLGWRARYDFPSATAR